MLPPARPDGNGTTALALEAKLAAAGIYDFWCAGAGEEHCLAPGHWRGEHARVTPPPRGPETAKLTTRLPARRMQGSECAAIVSPSKWGAFTALLKVNRRKQTTKRRLGPPPRSDRARVRTTALTAPTAARRRPGAARAARGARRGHGPDAGCGGGAARALPLRAPVQPHSQGRLLPRLAQHCTRAQCSRLHLRDARLRAGSKPVVERERPGQPLASHETDRLYFARFPERVRGPFRELMTNIHMVLLMFLR